MTVREMRERYRSSWLVAWLRVRTIRKADAARARRVCAETLQVERETGCVAHYRIDADGKIHAYASRDAETPKVAPPPWLGDGVT